MIDERLQAALEADAERVAKLAEYGLTRMRKGELGSGQTITGTFYEVAGANVPEEGRISYKRDGTWVCEDQSITLGYI